MGITRYREVAGTLGESATIVSGLSFREDAIAPMAVDREGYLYVALPAPADTAGLNSDAIAEQTGRVLRFTRDGLVPPTNRGASPVIAEGYATPRGLAVDAQQGRLWLAGDND